VPRLYPLYHKLTNRPVVVIGGGRIALRRVKRLVEAGSRVKLVSPEILPEIRELVEAGDVEWHERPYEDGDLGGAEFALVASGDLGLVREVRHAADVLGIPLNTAEDESSCDFHVPGMVEWGGIRMAISSEGANPAIVAKLRRELEEWLASVPIEKVDDLGAERLARARVRESKRPRSSRGEPESGKVYLVGGGPGDPSLLTVRAAQLLDAADIVYYDRLVGQAVLETIPATAEQVYVGKDVGCAHRANIAELMIAAARAGKIVVRLKGGDPVLFGRAGEEMEALNEAGIDFEVVPGVSSLSSVPISANIPITYRGVASELVVRSGHRMSVDDELPANRTRDESETTFVYFMAVRRLPRVVEDLRAEGLAASTPVAIVQNGTLPDEQIVTGTLGDIVHVAEEAGVEAPALVIAGEVVRLRERLAVKPKSGASSKSAAESNGNRN